MLQRIWAAIVAFFLCLFPCLQKTPPLDNAAVANTVIAAVKAHDVAALEELMCKNIKENVPDLSGEISNLLDAVEGELLELSWSKMGGYQESNGKGKTISQNFLDIHIVTSTGPFILTITLETYNNFSPEEMGARRITIAQKTTPASAALYVLTATNGCMSWHD